MKLRSGRTTVATPPSFGDGDSVSHAMNASLWGELQSFIDLSLIYVKLPLAPFFRLRQVCKEWNRLASDRQFLERNFKPPISNLYFVVARRTGHHLWTSQGSSWTSSPLPRSRCEVSGLLYEESDRNRVFDLHTRVFHSLPPSPYRMVTDNSYVVGMTVDTTLIPYGFRVFIIDYFGTNIYDSNSGAWMWKLSVHMYSGPKPSTLSSVLYDKFLYLLVKAPFYVSGCHVHIYDVENFVWSTNMFRYPQVGKWEYGGIGVWRDRWFAFGMKPKSVLTAWEMNTHFEESWTKFDSMSKKLCQWMMMTRGLGYQNVLSTFCGEHVLVYNCLEVEERAVLYNLDRKTWDKIEVVGNTDIIVKNACAPK